MGVDLRGGGKLRFDSGRVHVSTIDSINHSIGVLYGTTSEPSPDYDPGAVLVAGPGHDWTDRDRWRECARCAVRDYWPASEGPCIGPAPSGTVTLADALIVLCADLAAFGVWWRGRRHVPALPSLDEWAAEFLEWRIGR